MCLTVYHQMLYPDLLTHLKYMYGVIINNQIYVKHFNYTL